MDSCVCAALAARDYDAAAVHVSYGQRTEKRERSSFAGICDRLGIRHRLVVRNEALEKIGGSALTDRSIAVPEACELGGGVPVTYVPFRNAHFLAVAVSWAEVLGAEKVYIGAVEPDSSGYPDCRPAYYNAFNELIRQGTKDGQIEVVTPLIAMRVIPTVIPDLAALKLPPQIADVAHVRNGIVLVTGGTSSGKSSTLAALLDRINSEYCYHIVTVEDPIEFLHNHKKSTIHQREVHSDAPNFALALRAALRQAPRVILVGEVHERETFEILLEAAENGHLVLSTMNTVDAAKTIERIVNAYPVTEQMSVRDRLAKTFRYIISQRLIPKADHSGRIAVVEILKSNARTRECIEQGEKSGKTLLDAMKASEGEGMPAT